MVKRPTWSCATKFLIMRIGIISEGHADRAVIANILTGLVTGLEMSDIIALRPTYSQDETDKALNDPKTKSSYSIMKEECESKELMDGFFAQDGHDFIVLHIDTAEADKYGVERPEKNDEYCEQLREAVINQINDWLSVDLSDKILYAIAIEEIDAWVLPVYEKKDSTKIVDAKKKLNFILSKKGVKYDHDPFQYYRTISKPLSKKKHIDREKLLTYNCSLNLFYEEVQAKVLARLVP